MATIAHRELRNDSAEILRRAASGESFEVTNNGRVVAMVVPPPESALDRYLQARLLAPPSARSLLTLALTLPALAQSNEATLRKTLEDRLKLKVEKVGKTPVAGLYEVIADGRLMYTDEKGAYLFMGDLFDTRTQKNLSAEKRFSLLPLDGAIKMVRGTGKNVLVTFEDPNCSYCKKLVRELQGVKDITIYTFLLPVLSEDSVTKSRAIWCSADRAMISLVGSKSG